MQKNEIAGKTEDKSYLCSVKHLYKYITLLSLLLTVVSLHAQTPSQSGLRFANDTFDYGHIREEGGAVVCRFEAKNESMADIEVINIVTTCGCTSARYERGMVPAGAQFSFEVSYDPMNRPGRIDKHIFVHTSDAEEPIKLHIVGYVQPRERSLEELYPFDMGGGLRLASNFHAFGYVEAGKSVEESIRYVNTSGRDIELRLDVVTRSGLLEVDAPKRIAADVAGDIVLRYVNPADSGIYGSVEDKIVVVVDGVAANYTIGTLAIAVDNFDAIDDISAPRLVISKNIIKFGEVNDSNRVLEQSLVLRNEGSSPLLLRAVESESEAIEVMWSEARSIAPGASANILLRLRGSHIDDWDNPLVTRIKIITNDPIRPMQVVRANALPM